MTNSALIKKHQASDVNLLFAMLSILLKEAEQHPQNFWQLAMVVQAWALSAQFFSTSVHLQSDIMRALSDSLQGHASTNLPAHKNTAPSDNVLETPVLSDDHNESMEKLSDDEEEQLTDTWLHA